MVLVNARRFRGLIGVVILTSAVVLPIACSNSQFEGCKAHRTCKPENSGGTGIGGEAGSETGGTSSSGASGRSGSAGISGMDSGGEGGRATGGRGGNAGDGETGGGGHGDRGGEGGEGGTPDVPDTTPPTVVSVSPPHGATGVPSGTNIVITFSEPMNTMATEAAYESADVPANAVAMTWSADRRVLTIDPNAPLTYASGADPTSVTARTYAFTITTAARDAAGNSLAQAYNWSIRTLRRIVHTLRPVISTDRPSDYWAFSRVQGLPMGALCPAPVKVGAWPGPYLWVGIIAFQIAPLPAGVVDFESVSLSATQGAAVGSPFALAGNILAEHIPPVPINQGLTATEINTGQQALRELGVFSANSNVGPRSVDALAALETDYLSRAALNNTSTFRLINEHHQDQQGTQVEAYVPFDCESIALTATYTVP
jgi:hypothetical protein